LAVELAPELVGELSVELAPELAAELAPKLAAELAGKLAVEFCKPVSWHLAPRFLVGCRVGCGAGRRA